MFNSKKFEMIAETLANLARGMEAINARLDALEKDTKKLWEIHSEATGRIGQLESNKRKKARKKK